MSCVTPDGDGTDLITLMAALVVLLTLALAFRRVTEMAYLLILGNLVIFCLELVSLYVDGSSGGLSLLQIELSFRPSYLQTLESPWTMVTYMYVHSGFSHIVFNMLYLFLAGPYLEERVGKGRFGAIYLIGGIGSVLLFSIMEWGSDTLVMGASGAISAVLGGLLILYPRDRIPFFLGFLFLPNVPVWIAVGSWFVIQIFMAFSTAASTVAYSAHVAGFVIGMGVALATSRHIERDEGRSIDISSLEELAVTPQLRDALEHIRDEEDPELRHVWLEYFAENSTCPRCGERPKVRGETLRCGCGHVGGK